MPRRPRPLVANGTYHVYSRSRPDFDLLASDAERRGFLSIANRRMLAHGWVCMGFCLMPNHFHFLVRTPEGDLHRGMHGIIGEHVRRVHGRSRTSGPVMRGRYGCQLLTKESHFLEVLRYIPLNPCRSGLTTQPSAWPWSSHRALAGEQPPPPMLDVGAVYEAMQDILGASGPEAYLHLLNGAPDGPEVVPFPRGPALRLDPPLVDLLGGGSPQEIARAHLEHGYSLTSIAAALGCARRTVTRRLREAAG